MDIAELFRGLSAGIVGLSLGYAWGNRGRRALETRIIEIGLEEKYRKNREEAVLIDSLSDDDILEVIAGRKPDRS